MIYLQKHCLPFFFPQDSLCSQPLFGTAAVSLLSCLFGLKTSLESGKEPIPLEMGVHPSVPRRALRMLSRGPMICEAFGHKGKWCQRINMGEKWDREGITRGDVNALN